MFSDLKLENMSTESRSLFDGIGIDLPSDYFTPFHQSGNFRTYDSWVIFICHWVIKYWKFLRKWWQTARKNATCLQKRSPNTFRKIKEILRIRFRDFSIFDRYWYSGNTILDHSSSEISTTVQIGNRPWTVLTDSVDNSCFEQTFLQKQTSTRAVISSPWSSKILELSIIRPYFYCVISDFGIQRYSLLWFDMVILYIRLCLFSSALWVIDWLSHIIYSAMWYGSRSTHAIKDSFTCHIVTYHVIP